jgi:hypothetical protein
LLQLQKYNITVTHILNKNIPVSDCLSRQCILDWQSEEVQGFDTHMHTVCKQLHFTDQGLQNISEITSSDKQMLIFKTNNQVSQRKDQDAHQIYLSYGTIGMNLIMKMVLYFEVKELLFHNHSALKL